MVSAVWKDITLATSDETVLNGIHYSPPSVNQKLLEVNKYTSASPVKCTARYFLVNDADGQGNILARNADSSVHLGPSRLQASALDSLRGP